MGCFQIWQIEFLHKDSKKYFEKLKLHQRILCSYNFWDDDIPLKKRSNITTYHMGWDGYAMGSEFLQKHLKKINIKKFHSLDLTGRSNWWDELKYFLGAEYGKKYMEIKTKTKKKK